MGNEGRNVGKDAKATPNRIESVSCAIDHLDAVAETITGRHGAVNDLNDGILLDEVTSDGLDQDRTGHARGAIDDENG